LAERDGLLGELDGGARLDLLLQLRPAREAVFAGERELGGREREPIGHAVDTCERVGVAGTGGAEQVLGLVAELLEVGVSRECRHDVSFSGLRSADQATRKRHGSLLAG
jgi:hypothetical protein